MSAPNPFTDPAVVPSLYATADRTMQRSGALLSAKTAGRDISEVVIGLAHQAGVCAPTGESCPGRPFIADLGCGRGGLTLRMAKTHPRGVVHALDASPAMIHQVRERTAGLANVHATVADFHALPFRDSGCDLITAVMCLYHSATPLKALTEIQRCLRPGSPTILVTKAADSYRELAELLTDRGLDPEATNRPSLYGAASSTTLHELAGHVLKVNRVEHERHEFVFPDFDRLAAYLVTCPQYRLPDGLHEAPALAAEMRRRIPEEPVTASATVTYIVAEK